MADMHVLAGGNDAKSWQVIMHFDVPDQDNAVGVNYRTALVNSGIGGTTQMTEGTAGGQITTAEKAQVEAGARFEWPVTLSKLESGGTSAGQLQASLQKFYAQQKDDLVNQLQVRLRYFGHEESEV